MRTTITLEPDVAHYVEDAVRRSGLTFKEVVNDALRRALTGNTAPSSERVVVPVHHTSLRPGFDPGRMNQLADELDDDAVARRT